MGLYLKFALFHMAILILLQGNEHQLQMNSEQHRLQSKQYLNMIKGIFCSGD